MVCPSAAHTSNRQMLATSLSENSLKDENCQDLCGMVLGEVSWRFREDNESGAELFVQAAVKRATGQIFD